jgi:hypothetical protein
LQDVQQARCSSFGILKQVQDDMVSDCRATTCIRQVQLMLHRLQQTNID